MHIKSFCKKSYGEVTKSLPVSIRSAISRIIFHISGKPFYFFDDDLQHKTRFDKGLLCISADFELAWGWRYAKNQKLDAEEFGIRERRNIPLILTKLDELKIPITWAIVGHLFIEKCERGKNGLPHSDMPRPCHFENELWRFNSGDWYDYDPCSSWKSAPDWYAPDLIEKIMNSNIKHEIACHSFSHIGFDEAYCSRELADAELRKCIEVMDRFGLKPISMIFPGNEAGYFDLLTKYGFKCMRYFPYEWVDIAKPIKTKEELWSIPESSNIVPDENWDSKYILRRLKKYVDKAVSKKALCHFWFHPSMKVERIKGLFFPLLKYLAEKRTEGKLDILTMRGVGEFMAKFD